MAFEGLGKALKPPKKDKKGGDLPESAEDWVMYVNHLHTDGLNRRRKYEFQWVLNLAYYLGYQNLIFNPRSGALEIPRVDAVPFHVNRIGSFTESRHAKLTKNRPKPFAIPNTNDIQDQRAAKYLEMLIKHLWRKIDVESEYERMIMHMLVCGNGFIETLWDPVSGDSVISEEKIKAAEGEGVGFEMFLNDEGTEIMEEKVYLGEVSTKAISPFSIIPANDSIQKVCDQDWMMKRSHISVNEVYRLYPHLRDKVKPMDDESQKTEYERIVDRLASPVFATNKSTIATMRDSVNSEVLVKTLYMKPNWQYQDGVVAVVINDEIASIQSFPNDFGRNAYPFVRFAERNDGYHFWQQSTIERLIPIQRVLNSTKEQKVNNIHDMANVKWLSPKGAQISEDSFTDESGEIIEYNPLGGRPEQASIAPLPNYVREFDEELIIDFRDVGGQREASVSPPPNLTAAVALQTASEQADEIIGPIIRRIAKGLEMVGEQQAILMNEEYDDERVVKVIGDDGRYAVHMINGADLRGNTDIHFEVESMFPDLRGAKRQFLFDMWDRRIIQDPEKFLRALRYGDYDSIIDDMDRKLDTIALDIARIKKGKEPEIFPAQDHMRYAVEVSKFMATPEFLRLIPERKQLMINFMQAHLDFLMQSLPGGGEPQTQTQQAGVGTPFGAQVPVGAPGTPAR